ncbi:MAG TPA: LL-diaminopimelate aminotransferase [Candidatus Omnitrophota bacterium]|nr:LL-diaminopimelate aminotransferase [Candidatus Omnitrophota bacterium]HPD85330.1 LL-diaminopimelate aminotransferase [Candidatus Omnitrophota bacterium]HRZ04169.1 LL-diaminopimelate aminotransferase [Candidatus Omnitrophota bacterium]
MPINIDYSERLKQLPPYLFVEIDKAKREAKAAGRDIIDLGVGDPDLPTPKFIVEALNKAAQDGANHHYAFDSGLKELRVAIAEWYQGRFGVRLDPDTEIYPLIGSKEGIAHLPLAVVNPKDKVLVPDPCYPVYRSATIFAGGKVVSLPLKAKNEFLPDLEKVEKTEGAKLMYLNYPNNPTSAVAPKEFLAKLVSIAQAKGIVLASDLAYSEIYYDEQKPSSILEIEGAKDVAIEFHSLSKTFSMTGWRLGWACGNAKLISALAKVKANVDSGIFQAIQIAGIAALKGDPREISDMRAVYQERRDCLINGLRSIGWKIPPPKAAFYVWAKIPKNFNNSMEAAQTFLEKANIVMTPGVGFGENGEGYIRMTLTVPKERLTQAVERIQKIL